MKKIYLLATALAALVSCTSEEYVGENNSPTTKNVSGAIQFASKTGKITRATSNSGTTAEMLDGQFKLYGVKHTTAWSKVFEDYVVKSSTGTQTTSNPDLDWEYVLASGTSYGSSSATTSKDQTIKYWDHAADYYHFVAGSPVSSFTFALDDTAGDNLGNIKTATVTGLAGHLNPNTTGTGINTDPVYIADPVKVPEASFRQDVTLNFVRQQSRVRVGVYETIPGYKITDIHFYTNGAAAAETTNSNIILTSGTTGYFVGATAATATLTYDWTTPTYDFAYESTGLTTAQNWYGGALTGVKATTSSHAVVNEFYGTDDDRDASGYFTVIPTPSATTAAPILIKCDYTLTSLGLEEHGDGSGETIKVYGATAAVPAAFSKWAPNTSYTYIFKISDNTNGKTNTGKDPVGLYPITFDAVAVAEANTLGTITTVSTPAITTYQEGSVSTEGITYATAATTKPIYITVNTDGTLAYLTAENTKLYSLTGAATEADLISGAKTGTEVTGDNALSILADSEESQDITFAAHTTAKFIPAAGTIYAVEYTGYTGKSVEAGATVDGYYTRTNDAEPYTYTVASGTAAAAGTYYIQYKQYKVIEVAAAGGGGGGARLAK